jgi:hypothetical protein
MTPNPFSLEPPDWTTQAVHATGFTCPRCQAQAKAAKRVWINRRSPVLTETYRRLWQEFYDCGCGQAWWAWSGDRPPSKFVSSEPQEPLP